MQGFRKHQIVDPLEAPGHTDLTANVDFSYLSEAMADLGTSFVPLLSFTANPSRQRPPTVLCPNRPSSILSASSRACKGCLRTRRRGGRRRLRVLRSGWWMRWEWGRSTRSWRSRPRREEEGRSASLSARTRWRSSGMTWYYDRVCKVRRVRETSDEGRRSGDEVGRPNVVGWETIVFEGCREGGQVDSYRPRSLAPRSSLPCDSLPSSPPSPLLPPSPSRPSHSPSPSTISSHTRDTALASPAHSSSPHPRHTQTGPQTPPTSSPRAAPPTPDPLLRA